MSQVIVSSSDSSSSSSSRKEEEEGVDEEQDLAGSIAGTPTCSSGVECEREK